MLAGQLMEPTIKELVERKLGEKIGSGPHLRVKHKDYPFLAGSPDGINFLKPRGYEFKLVTNQFIAREFGDDTDEVPARYLIQVQWYAMLTGIDQWILAAFFATNGQLKTFAIERDEELGDMLLKRAVDFWQNNVEKRVAPEESDSAIVKTYLSRRYPSHGKDMLEADEELRKLAYKWAHVRHECKRLDTEREELENTFRAVIGSDEGIAFDADNFCTWRKAKDGRKTDEVAAYSELTQHVSEKLAQDIWERHTRPVVGSRRLLPHGPMFKSDPTVADMRGTLLEKSV
jgi:predicted phage-related endonuclease